jgi:hypothetical protein
MTTWRLLTEDGDYLITEGGDQLINETIAADLICESSINADLHVITNFSANLVCSSSVTAGLTTSIRAQANLTAASAITAGLTTNIKLAASIDAASSVTSALTTSVRLSSTLVAVSSVTAGLTTAIKMASSLVASSSISAEIVFYRPINAQLACASSIVASIKTAIRLNSQLSVASSVTAALTTAITPIAALIAVSTVISADLTVLRLPVRYAKRNKYIYLAEITAYDPATSAEITWRFSTGDGYDNEGVFYAPRIENPALLDRSISIQGGKASSGYGELTLVNVDGGINDMASDYFDGRSLTLKRGLKTDPYASFSTILKATIESAAMERERVSIRLRDKTYLLDTPHQTNKYAGTNVLPNGLEGTPDNIMGQMKPKIYGRIALMQPVLVNTSKLIYQVNDGTTANVVNVFDAGAYLSRGIAYSSEAEMLSTAPVAGEWRAYGGYFRLGSAPFKAVSACVVEDWDYHNCTAAGLIQRLLTEKGFTSSDWVAADFTALNAKNAGSIGLIVGDGETTASLIERICASVGAWWGVDALNRFRFARLDAPSGASTALISDQEILDIERQPESYPAVWQSTVKADTNYLQQERSALAGVVPDDRVNWFANITRDQVAADSAVKDVRLLADSSEAESSLNGISIASAEANRRLDLFSVRRDTVTLTVADPAGMYGDVDLGDVVTVVSSQLGYSSGRQMVVTRIRPDYQTNKLDLGLWG